MASHTATIVWERDPSEVFTDNRFGRGHQWSFDGGVSFRASSSPHVLPRHSDPAGVDPEEAFVASLSSCHMMAFLYVAARRGLKVNRYEDTAEGRIARNAEGRIWVSEVVPHPRVAWEGDAPDEAVILDLHHAAHAECFIANSVRTDVRCEPRD